MANLHADLDALLKLSSSRFPHLPTRAWEAACASITAARAKGVVDADVEAVRRVGLCIFVCEAYSRAISNGGRVLPRGDAFDASAWLPRGPAFALTVLTAHVTLLDSGLLHFVKFRDEFAARCELAGGAEVIGVDSVADLLAELDATSIATFRTVSCASSLLSASSMRVEITSSIDPTTAPALAGAALISAVSPSESRLTIAVSSRGAAFVLRAARISFGGDADAPGSFSMWAILNVHIPAARASSLPSTLLSVVIPQPCLGATGVESVLLSLCVALPRPFS